MGKRRRYQKNATQPKAWQGAICAAGLNPMFWTVIQELKFMLILKNRMSGEIRTIGKPQGGRA